MLSIDTIRKALSITTEDLHNYPHAHQPCQVGCYKTNTAGPMLPQYAAAKMAWENTQ